MGLGMSPSVMNSVILFVHVNFLCCVFPNFCHPKYHCYWHQVSTLKIPITIAP